MPWKGEGLCIEGDEAEWNAQEREGGMPRREGTVVGMGGGEAECNAHKGGKVVCVGGGGLWVR